MNIYLNNSSSNISSWINAIKMFYCMEMANEESKSCGKSNPSTVQVQALFIGISHKETIKQK